MFKRYFDLKQMASITLVLLIGLIVIYLFISMIRFNNNTNGQQTEHITDIIRKAAVTCYALEGSYPPDIQYLADNYQLVLDEERYHYYYTTYGSNIMPEIMVIAK